MNMKWNPGKESFMDHSEVNDNWRNVISAFGSGKIIYIENVNSRECLVPSETFGPFKPEN